jgi:hypothetical protein
MLQGSKSSKCCPKYLAKTTFWKHRVPSKQQATVEVVSGGATKCPGKLVLVHAKASDPISYPTAERGVEQGSEKSGCHYQAKVVKAQDVYIVSKPGVSLAGTFDPVNGSGADTSNAMPAHSAIGNIRAPAKTLSKLAAQLSPGPLTSSADSNWAYVCIPHQHSWV